MTTTSYEVSGLTCAHCVAAVCDEVGSLPGVSATEVDLVPGATSTLIVTSDAPLLDDAITRALDEAGDYQLV